jgi:hypothetical protein
MGRQAQIGGQPGGGKRAVRPRGQGQHVLAHRQPIHLQGAAEVCAHRGGSAGDDQQRFADRQRVVRGGGGGNPVMLDRGDRAVLRGFGVAVEHDSVVHVVPARHKRTAPLIRPYRRPPKPSAGGHGQPPASPRPNAAVSE